MSVTERINHKLSSLPKNLSDLIDVRDVSLEEKGVINEAGRLADDHSDIKPNHLVVSETICFINNSNNTFCLVEDRNKDVVESHQKVIKWETHFTDH